MGEKTIEKEKRFVCFNLLDEEYGLDVSHVLGINPMVEVVRVPKVPDFVEGIMRIRGTVLPVIDLRKRFGLPGNGHDGKSRIMVVRASGVLTGLIVDGVSKVIGIPVENIEPPSPVLKQAKFLSGVGRLDNGLLLILDANRILSTKEVRSLATTVNRGRDGAKKEEGQNHGK